MHHSRKARTIVAGVALAALAACHDDDSGAAGTPAPVSTEVAATPLVTNQSSIDAARHDARLVNPWGLAFAPAGPAWIANAGSNTVTAYDGNGAVAGPAVSIPGGSRGAAGPAGIVFNPIASDFIVTANTVTGPADFIVAGTGGTIAAWSSRAGFGNRAITVHNGAASEASYTGLARLGVNGSTFLFAADFHNGRIITFDNAFNEVTTSGGFLDAGLPAGFAPFNIQAVNDQLVVTYAKQSDTGDGEEPGPGLGYVNLFDGQGRLIRRIASEGELNAPWGVALAPPGFGGVGNSLLVGNFGDGRINAYDMNTGTHVATLRDASGEILVIEGLWALAFGNNAGNQPANTLFYTAGTNSEVDGTFGRLVIDSISLGGNTGNNGGISLDTTPGSGNPDDTGTGGTGTTDTGGGTGNTGIAGTPNTGSGGSGNTLTGTPPTLNTGGGTIDTGITPGTTPPGTGTTTTPPPTTTPGIIVGGAVIDET
jgi:uncharacterized protein (TIGR03118 family)